MWENERDWIRAVERTWVVRFPRQTLATFGASNIAYYVVTEPVYQDMNNGKREGVVRTGKVVAERPAVVTPMYAMNLEGFSSEAYEYLEHLAQQYGHNSPGILYQYRNEADRTDILSGTTDEIANRISDDLDSRNQNMAVVMVGVDEYWDVALLKFIYEYTSSSASHNVNDLRSRGLLEPQAGLGGVPRAAAKQIENMFRDVERGSASPDFLKQELDRWGLFNFYEDRFLSLFRRKGR
jgi:hypothetical protein